MEKFLDKLNTKQIITLLVIICFLISSIGVLITVKDLQSKKFHDTSIQATVVTVDIRTDSDGDKKYKPTFSYTYKDKTYTNNYGWSDKRYKVGQTINIQINSDNPSKVYKSNLWIGIILLLSGVIIPADLGIKHLGRKVF